MAGSNIRYGRKDQLNVKAINRLSSMVEISKEIDSHWKTDRDLALSFATWLRGVPSSYVHNPILSSLHVEGPSRAQQCSEMQSTDGVFANLG
ncbi:unnamed protein product [Allacma fusca]|uniref:Uncharacterized protein n=1 Tax=Allacma fusca TaxID=39272 RepID=A0A8J2PPH4_9HEXA|nr:unnamed protein product [Allacma fusca]